MVTDHAVNSRLGQRASEDNTAIQIVDDETLPEAAWHGMMVYRSDTQVLQVYRSSLFGGDDAFEDVVGGVAGLLTFVGDTPPTAVNVGDLWFKTDTERTLYRSASIGANEIKAGEWVLVQSELTAEEISDPLPEALEIANLTATNIEGITISAGQITGGEINGTEINGSEINGGTVTGAVLQTAATGNRIKIFKAGLNGLIQFDSGDGDETAPALIQSITHEAGGKTDSFLYLRSGQTTDNLTGAAEITLSGGSTVTHYDGSSTTSSATVEVTKGRLVTNRIPSMIHNDWRGRSRLSSATSIPTATYTKPPMTRDTTWGTDEYIVFDNANDLWFSDAFDDNVLVHIIANVTFAANATGRRGIRIRHEEVDGGGAPYTLAAQNADSWGNVIMDMNVCAFVELGLFDQIWIEVTQNSGAGLQVLAADMAIVVLTAT